MLYFYKLLYFGVLFCINILAISGEGCYGYCKQEDDAVCDALASKCRGLYSRQPPCYDVDCPSNAACNATSNMCQMGLLKGNATTPSPFIDRKCSTYSDCPHPTACDQVAGKCRNTKTKLPSCHNDCPKNARCDTAANMCQWLPSPQAPIPSIAPVIPTHSDKSRSTPGQKTTAGKQLSNCGNNCLWPLVCDKIAGICRNVKTHQPLCMASDCGEEGRCDATANACQWKPEKLPIN